MVLHVLYACMMLMSKRARMPCAIAWQSEKILIHSCQSHYTFYNKQNTNDDRHWLSVLFSVVLNLGCASRTSGIKHNASMVTRKKMKATKKAPAKRPAARKAAKKPARKPVRKVARKPAKKVVRKPAKKVARKPAKRKARR